MTETERILYERIATLRSRITDIALCQDAEQRARKAKAAHSQDERLGRWAVVVNKGIDK